MPIQPFGRADAQYDAARVGSVSALRPDEGTLFIPPLIFANPLVTTGAGFIDHTPRPWDVLVPTGGELDLLRFHFRNLQTVNGASQFYGLKMEFDTDALDTGAGIALYNAGKSDAMYINVAGKSGNPIGNSPTGIGMDINKEIASSVERASANSSQQGIQIFDWSTTNQSVGGPRCILLQKVANLNTDHFLMTLRSNRNMQQMVVVSGDAGYLGDMPVWMLDDETTSAHLVTLLARGEFVFHQNGRGIQWLTPGSMTAYILASGNDLKLKSGGTGIRLVNQADTQTGLIMQDNLDVVVGLGGPATTATAGLLYVPGMAGRPTGVPSAYGGWQATMLDKTNRKFWFYDTTWKSISGSIWYDVEDFGAVGDGITIDTTAIQDALNAAAAAGGGVVYFPRGTYLIDNELVYGSKVTLRGDGGNSIIKNSTGRGASDYIMLIPDAATTVTDVLIEDLEFDQRSDSFGFSASDQCVSINEVARITIRHCVFRNIVSMAVWCDTKTADTTTEHIIIEGCRILNSEGGGFSLFGDFRDVLIANNQIENCKDDAIAVQDLATGEIPTDIVIADNVILNCDRRNVSGSTPAGIRVFGCTQVAVTGNLVDKTVSTNIMVQQGTARSTGVTVVGNRCHRAGVTIDSTAGVPLVGIYLLDADRVTVSGNVITDAQSVGLAVTDCDRITLVSNEVYNSVSTDLAVATSTNVKQFMTGGANIVRDGLNIGSSTDVTDGRLTIKGQSGIAPTQLNIYPSEHATSRRIGVLLDRWLLGQDLDTNGTKDFFIFDSLTSTRMRISTAGLISLFGSVQLGGAAGLVGMHGSTPVVQNTGWSVTGGYTADKAFNPESTTLTEVARVLGTLIDMLKTRGDLGA